MSAASPIQQDNVLLVANTAVEASAAAYDSSASSVDSEHRTPSDSVGAASPLAFDETEKAFRANAVSGNSSVNVVAKEEYHILNTVDVLDYVERTLSQWLPINEATGERLQAGDIVSSEEVGDGNLNLVFRLLDAEGRSRAVLKQSLPYVRCVGESWPLTLDRNRLEADTLIAHHAHSPAGTEKVLFHNSGMAVTVVEDLSNMVIWRRELVQAHHHEHIVGQIADYLARVHFFTSDFAQVAEEKKRAVQKVTNTEMCRITEDLFFADPFLDHPRNNFEPEELPVIEEVLRQDARLKVKVAQLKKAFMTKAEAHLHGDIHSGSVFIDGSRVKAIDAEFGFYGPIGFDIGTVVGNLLMNYLALPAIQAQLDAAHKNQEEVVLEEPASREPTDLTAGTPATRELLLASLDELWSTYESTFLALAADPDNLHDATFAFPGYAQAFLEENVLADTIGFAGAEMIRRTVGLAHVADLDGIKDKTARLAAKEQSLRLGSALVKRAKEFSTFADVLAFVKSGSY